MLTRLPAGKRGSNANFNGLLRQYIPKKRPLSTVTADELKMIQDRINHRPRKRLVLKTPYEAFHQYLKRVALRTDHYKMDIRCINLKIIESLHRHPVHQCLLM